MSDGACLEGRWYNKRASTEKKGPESIPYKQLLIQPL